MSLTVRWGRSVDWAMSGLEFLFHLPKSRSCAVKTESWMPEPASTEVPKSPWKTVAPLLTEATPPKRWAWVICERKSATTLAAVSFATVW